MPLTYLASDRVSRFEFEFVQNGQIIDIICTSHPGYNGQDPSPVLTHLFPSGKICFVAGKAPRDMDRAKKLAQQWSEYFLNYRQTGHVEA